MESNSFNKSVGEFRDDPQTSTALFCFAILYDPKVCEPWMHCVLRKLTSSGTYQMPSWPAR